MNRSSFPTVIAYALLCSASASATDGLLPRAITTGGPQPTESIRWQSTAVVPQHSTVLVQSFAAPTTQIADFIRSPHQAASPASVIIEPRSSDFAAWIHPLANPTEPTFHTSFELGHSALSGISAARSPAIVTPVTFDPSRDLFREFVSASPSIAAAFRIR